MLTIKCDWPWDASPREAPFEMIGDLASAVAFGIADDEEGLREITALICSGLPDEVACRATWSISGKDALCVEVDSLGAQFRQRFVRQEDGIVVKQDLLILDGVFHHRGHAKRLIKNLLIVYDHLKIVHASTYANHGNGGYTWALFGARPFDIELQRRALEGLLDRAIELGAVDVVYRDEILEIIDETPDDELMQEIASLAGAGSRDIGKALLVSHSWEAYWDLSCPKFRTYIGTLLQ